MQLDNARQLYNSVVKKQFPYEHCWKILKNERKWSDNMSHNHKKQKSHSAAASSPSTLQSVNFGDDNGDFNHHERPMGQKAAKQKKKNRLAGEVEKMALARILDQYRL